VPLEGTEQAGVAADEARLEQVGEHGDVADGLFEAFVHRSHAVPDIEPDVPEQPDHLGQALAGVVVGRVERNSRSTSEHGKSSSRP
jgi:hypothetical protein